MIVRVISVKKSGRTFGEFEYTQFNVSRDSDLEYVQISSKRPTSTHHEIV